MYATPAFLFPFNIITVLDGLSFEIIALHLMRESHRVWRLCIEMMLNEEYLVIALLTGRFSFVKR